MILTAHDYFMDCAEAYCPDCEWYGNDSELSQEKQAPFDSVLCPDCSARLSEPYNTMDLNSRQICTDEIDSFVQELTYHAIQFNRKHGKNEYTGQGRYNAIIEININGNLNFVIVDQQKFIKRQFGEPLDYNLVQFEDLNINQPEHFDIYKARDLLRSFAVFSNRIERKQKESA